MPVTPVTVISEFTVNTTDTAPNGDDQIDSSVVGLLNGGFAIAWEDFSGVFNTNNPTNATIAARIFDPLGNPLSPDFELANQSDYRQLDVDLAATRDGGFLAAWSELPTSVTNTRIMSGRFDADGGLEDSIFPTQGGPGSFTQPVVMEYSSREIIWTSVRRLDGESQTDLYRSIYAPRGNSVGGGAEILPDTFNQARPRFDLLENNLVATVFEDTTASGVQISLVITTTGNSAIGGKVTVANPAASAGYPDVAAANGGSSVNSNFGVVYRDFLTGDIFFRSYQANSSGATVLPLTDGTAVNTTDVNGAQATTPRIVALDSNTYAVVWGYSDVSQIRLQLIHQNGEKIGNEVLIDSTDSTTDLLEDPDIDLMLDGRIVVSYTSGDPNKNSDIKAVVLDPRSQGDIVVGTNFGETLTAPHPGGTVNGRGGNDNLVGSPNADTLIGGSGNDILDGNGGIDTASYSDALGGVIVSLISGTSSGARGNDTLSEIENITGSPFDDSLTGDGVRNIIDAGLGNDFVSAFHGEDLIFGRAGNDTINSGAANDTVFGGPGYDFIEGEQGSDTILGGPGNDTIFGGQANDLIHGEVGDDTIDGETGMDNINGGAGNDMLFGGADNDSVVGGPGSDTIEGGSGNDFLSGEGGFDNIKGGTGSDQIFGGDLNDMLFGEVGNDQIFGGTGNDMMDGGDGNDRLDGFNGVNTMTGGAGADFFIINAAPGLDTITDYNAAEGDRIDAFAPGTQFSLVAGTGGTFLVHNPTSMQVAFLEGFSIGDPIAIV